MSAYPQGRKKLKADSLVSAAVSSGVISTGTFLDRRDKGTPESHFCMDTSPICEGSFMMTQSPPKVPPHYRVTSKMERDFNSHVAPC